MSSEGPAGGWVGVPAGRAGEQIDGAVAPPPSQQAIKPVSRAWHPVRGSTVTTMLKKVFSKRTLVKHPLRPNPV